MKLFFIHKREIIENSKYMFFSLLTSIFIFLPQIILFTRFKRLAEVLVMTLVLFLLSKVSRLIYVLLSIYLIITVSIISHINIHWGSKGIVSRIEVALLSPPQETLEYLKTYVNVYDIFLVIYVLLGFFLIYKLLRNYHHTFKIVKISALILIIGILSSVTLLYKNPFIDVLPLNLAYSYEEALKWKDLVDRRENYLKNTLNTNHSNVSLEQIAKYTKVIIVMGESASRNHMQVYGYDQATTPFLTQVMKSDQWFLLNAIAPANQTRYAVPLCFTDATVKNFQQFVQSKSLVSDFKEYGYKTYWLSNQAQIGKHETYISSIAGEADMKIIKNPDWLTAKTQTDKNILDMLDHMKPNNQKEMYVIHLLGSHHRYKDRYLGGDDTLIKEPKSVIDEYDNSIYFTDYVLSKIYDKFKNSKMLLIYLSDHAEVVTQAKHGHGFLPPYKDEFEIPFVIYSTLINERIKNIRFINQTSRINTESFNHIVKYLMGMENNMSNISFSTNIFALDPKNIFDYDSLKRHDEMQKRIPNAL